MNPNERFIDRNIAELCKDFDRIRGANVNISRISPLYIDGLKPVQRRALYIMYLKDQGKKYRKLATISGEVFGRVHPHAPENIENALVGLAQEWNNIIPLIDGEGNWGCHDEETEVLTRDGWKFFKNISKEDLLASVNPDTGELIFEHPTEIFCYPYKGELIQGRHKSLNFAVTPNHKMVVWDYSERSKDFNKSFHFIEASNLLNYSGIINKFYQIKGNNIDDIIEEEIIYKGCHISTIQYEGNVYCAEVPTYHTLITRRGDCILLSGNSVSGDPAGASRYIQARLSSYAYKCFFEDWKESVVDMIMAYDEETKEPLYLPARYPNILLNGTLGIGYGMSSNLPTFNFKEVVESCMILMANPDADIVLVPDSPTGSDVIEGNFKKICDAGNGVYFMRCKYEIHPENNLIRITALPYQVSVNSIRERIADIKEQNGLPELINMHDYSGKIVDLQLIIRDDVNPYKFMRKLIEQVGGLEKSYPVNITVINDYESFDYSIKTLLNEWIRYRREQKRIVINHRRTTLLAEQRTNDVRIFLMSGDNLQTTLDIFKGSRNRTEIESRLVEKYRHSEIRMDSLQARTLSDMRMHELSIDSYENCIKRRDQLTKEIQEVEDILNTDRGIDKVIIGELKEGIKLFGAPRKSSIVSKKISVDTEVEGTCILQLSSDGIIIRRTSTNIEEEPVPADNNGFAVKVDNDSSFIAIDEDGYYSFIRVKEIPVDTEVPINRFMKQKLGSIAALLPFDIESDQCCTLISSRGVLKKILISDMKPSKRPCIDLSKGDKIIRGIVTKMKSVRDILIYTNNGMGQRLDPNNIRITSTMAKGGNGFKLKNDDEIIGCYSINPEENQYLIYLTTKGKIRKNLIDYLPMRDSKNDKMVRLITLPERDRLLMVCGCNKYDKLRVFYNDGKEEVVDLNSVKESTMSELPEKAVNRPMVSNYIVKGKIV